MFYFPLLGNLSLLEYMFIFPGASTCGKMTPGQNHPILPEIQCIPPSNKVRFRWVGSQNEVKPKLGPVLFLGSQDSSTEGLRGLPLKKGEIRLRIPLKGQLNEPTRATHELPLHNYRGKWQDVWQLSLSLDEKAGPNFSNFRGPEHQIPTFGEKPHPARTNMRKGESTVQTNYCQVPGASFVT